MTKYSILITGTGPLGTGDPATSADLMAAKLATTLREAGHQIDHASIEGPQGTSLLIGTLTKHPEPKKTEGGDRGKTGKAKTTPKDTGEGSQEKQEPGNNTPEEVTPKPTDPTAPASGHAEPNQG